MTKYQSKRRMLILSEKQIKTSAYIQQNKIFIILGLILNCLLMNTVIFMFYDMTKELTNLEDSSPGLPLKVDIVLGLSALLQTIFAILIAYKVWRLGSMRIEDDEELFF